MTRSPGLNSETEGPTATTVPAPYMIVLLVGGLKAGWDRTCRGDGPHEMLPAVLGL
jgi:hypothetical protein